ncbi:MAG: hypothetical protein ACE5JZ_12165 [Kiloniellales bacterium]
MAIALTFKAAALVVLYLAFFGPWQRPEVTPAGLETTLFEAARSDSAGSAGDD